MKDFKDSQKWRLAKNPPTPISKIATVINRKNQLNSFFFVTILSLVIQPYSQAYWYQGEIDNLNIFSDYLEEVLSSYQPKKERENKLHSLFDDYFHNQTVDKSVPDSVLLDITKTELTDIIWKPLSSDSDRKVYICRVLQYPVFLQPIVNSNNLSSLFWQLVTVPLSSVKIFNNHTFVTKKYILKQWVLELLQEKIEENPESRAPIEMWLEHTDNLRIVQ